MDLVDVVNEQYANEATKNIPAFRSGDTLAVHTVVKEGEKSRIQVYQGTCIAIKHWGAANGHFRVRKTSDGVGVERVFPFHSPNVKKVEIVQRGKNSRAKLFFLRERAGKSARIKIDYDRKEKTNE